MCIIHIYAYMCIYMFKVEKILLKTAKLVQNWLMPYSALNHNF